MKKNELQELTTEELMSKKKTLKAVLIIMSSIVVMYLIIFIYAILTGTWRTNNTMGTVMLGMLGVLISTTTVHYGNISKILQQREEEK